MELCHTLKGVLRNFCLFSAADTAEKIENEVKENKVIKIDLVEKLKKEVETGVKKLNKR